MDTDGIEQLLTCPICLETLRSPKMLVCQHSLCRDCLKRYVLSSGRDQFVLCPTCRLPTPLPDPGGTTGVDALPTSFVLNSLIDAVASRSPVATSAPGRRRTSPVSFVPPVMNGSGVDRREFGLRLDEVRCDSCRQERQCVAAVMRCVDCDEFLCDACVKMHRRNKKSQQDVLVPVSEYMATAALASVNEYLAAAVMATAPDDAAASIGSQPANVGCGRHPNAAVTAFCTVCDCLVCTVCVISGCRPHRRVSIAEAADRARQRLMERCTRLRQLAGETMQQAAVLDSSIAATTEVERTVLSNLDSVRDVLIAAVNVAHASASAPVRLSAEENRCVMQSLLEEAQTQRLLLEGRADVLTAFLRPPPSIAADADRRRVLVMDVRLLARYRDLEADAAAHESAAAAACARFRPRRQLVPPFVSTATVQELIDGELARIFAIETPQVADPSSELSNIIDGSTAGLVPPSAGAEPAALFDSTEDDATVPPSLHRANSSSAGWGGGISSGNSSSADAVSGSASDQMPSAAPAATSAATSAEEDTAFGSRSSPSVERPRSLLLSSNAGSWLSPLSSDQPTASIAPLASFGSDEMVWRKICDIDTGRSCVRSIAFNIDGKLLAACDDGLKVAVREGISATLLPGDSSLVAVSDGGLIVVVLRAKRELRCYYQAGSSVAGPAPGSSEAGGGQLKLLWRRSLPQQKPSGSGSIGGMSAASGCALSLATQGDRVALLIDRALMLYRLADGNPVRTLRKAADGSLLFAGTSAIALDHRGRVVAIEGQGSCIRAMDDHGVTVWEQAGGVVSSSAGGNSPPRAAVEYSGLFVDATDDVYATDSLNHEVVVLRASDRSIARSLRSSVPAHSLLHCPKHLAVYKRTVAVCHTSVHRISVFRLEDREQPVRRNNVSPECTV